MDFPKEKLEAFNKKAWSKKTLGFLRTSHPDNMPSKLFRYPRGFGYAWIQWGKSKRLIALFMPIPFNWIARKIFDIYNRIKFGKSAEYGSLVYAKQAGFREGIETAIAIMQQSRTPDEAIRRLNESR